MDILETNEVSMVGDSSHFMPSVQISLLGNNIETKTEMIEKGLCPKQI
jgi:hypothetical protein